MIFLLGLVWEFNLGGEFMSESVKYANWVEIDLDALEYNFKGIKNKVSKYVKMCMVIKSNGYGHGAVRIAKFYEEIGADFLAVARTQEGLELRENGISLPILNLGYTDDLEISEAIENKISMTVFNYDSAKKIDEVAKKIGKKAYIHVKLDTGMSRLGFLVYDSYVEDSVEDIVNISKLENIVVQGAFTHFANADERIKEFERIQFDRFKDTIDELERRGVVFEYVHCSNSAEILDTDEEYNMIRPGIIQYGVYPSDEIVKSVDIKPVMTFKAKVTNVKELEAGISISYGRTYFTTSREKIISIAVGYADGFLRGRIKPYVTINGVNCPVVGRICMDQCMAKVPKDMDVSIGDVVTIFGQGGSSVNEIASSCNTIEHEVLCNINRRVPRIYKKDGKIIDIVNYL